MLVNSAIAETSEFTIDGDERIFFDLDEFFNDSIDLQVDIFDYNTETESGTYFINENNPEESFEFDGVNYTISFEDMELLIYGDNEGDKNHNINVTSIDENENVFFINFDLIINELTEPPQEIGSFLDLELETGSAEYIVDNVYDEFRTATIEFEADGETRTLTAERIHRKSDVNTYSGDEIAVWFDYKKDSNEFVIEIFKQGEETYEGDMNVQVCNIIGCEEQDFFINITEEPEPQPPSQIKDLPDINLEGTEFQILSMNEHFEDYNKIKVNFRDDSTNQILQNELGQGTSEVYFGDIEVTLSDFEGDIELRVDGTNTFYNEEFNVSAINEYGEVSDSFIVDVQEEPEPVIGNVTDEDLRTNIHSYWAFDDIDNFNDDLYTEDSVEGYQAEPFNQLFMSDDEVKLGDYSLGFGLGEFAEDSLLVFDDSEEKASADFMQNQHTFSIWLYASQIEEEMIIASHDDSFSPNQHIILDNFGDELKLKFFGEEQTIDIVETYGESFPEDEWVHLAYSIEDGTATTYLNNDILLETSHSGEFDVDDYMIGHIPSPDENGFIGYMDEMAFWDRKLNSSEIDELYDRQVNDSLGSQYDFSSVDPDELKQIADFPELINLEGENEIFLRMSDYFENFKELTLSFPDEELGEVITLVYDEEIGSGDGHIGEFDVELTNNLLIRGRDKDIPPREFTITASDKDPETPNIQDSFEVSSSVEEVEEPPNFFESIPNIEVQGFGRDITPIDEYGENYDEIRVSFPIENVTETISVSGDFDTDSYQDEERFELLLSKVLEEVDNFQVFGRNRHNEEDITISLVNEYGIDSQEVNLETEPRPRPSQVDGIDFDDIYIQDIEDSQPFEFKPNMDEDKYNNITSVNVSFYSDGDVRNLFLDEAGTESYGSIDDENELLVTLQKESLFGVVEWGIFTNSFVEWEVDNKPIEVIIEYEEFETDTFTLDLYQDVEKVPDDTTDPDDPDDPDEPIDSPPADSPDWFPEPPEGEEVFWAIAVLGLTIGLVAFGGFYTRDSFLATSTFGVIAFSVMFFLLVVIGWIPLWIAILVIIIVAMFLASRIWNQISGGGGV